MKIDLTNMRAGKLTALKQTGEQKYGSQTDSTWLCKCECGAELTLPYSKFPKTPKQLESVGRHGNPLIDRCEECKKPNCIVCGKKFVKRGTAKVCGAQECKNVLLENNKQKAKERYQNDAEVRKKVAASNLKSYHKNAEKRKAKMREDYSKMTEEQRKEIRNSWNERYRKTREDALKYRNQVQTKIYTFQEYLDQYYGVERGAKKEFCKKANMTPQELNNLINNENIRVVVDGDDHYYVTIRRSLPTKRPYGYKSHTESNGS